MSFLLVHWSFILLHWVCCWSSLLQCLIYWCHISWIPAKVGEFTSQKSLNIIKHCIISPRKLLLTIYNMPLVWIHEIKKIKVWNKTWRQELRTISPYLRSVRFYLKKNEKALEFNWIWHYQCVIWKYHTSCIKDNQLYCKASTCRDINSGA